MSLNQVPNVFPKTILDPVVKTTSFTTNNIPLDSNSNISLSLHVISSSSLTSKAKIQVSHDGSTWFDLPGTECFMNADGDFLWTIKDIGSMMQMRINVVVSSGSAIFMAISRGT